ncbi:phenylacetate--CoA ligase family protein [Legionella sp. CNM-1927-20]|uniref:phenylacetate--CoA ligase family protein n=1 Tax=Legionella sp. CNM-1927-20 TaxID=3422221 RepID=UPI00403A966B
MPNYSIDSPVILFNHPEYGQRLLFKNGITNPRDELGKNGVTIHNAFSARFYKTINIIAIHRDNKGVEKEQVFKVNRNSLIKYLGTDVTRHATNEQIITTLKKKLWHDTDTLQTISEKQIQAGTHGLRHAGQHNQQPLNRWQNALIDFFKGSFLSWLYQTTIQDFNLLRVRFLLVKKEKTILEAGEVLAKRRFHEAYKEVPAYQHHLTRFNHLPTDATTFKDIPITTKENYIKYQQHDSDMHRHGKYPDVSKTDTSTGTTGKPTEWVRGAKELDTVKKSLQIAAKIQFGRRKLSYINAFALGPWATGLTTYELMRDTGSVFATGPDKEKILDKLVSIRKYEKHQLSLSLDSWQHKHPRAISDLDEQNIKQFIEQVLAHVFKSRNSTLDDAFNTAFAETHGRTHQIIRYYKSEIKAIISQLNQERKQVVIAGYPPFLKDLTSYVEQKGYHFQDFLAIGIVGGQAISEAMRDQLISHGFLQIYSSYGASDLDINLGVETEFEIGVRKAIEQYPGLARELYGENKGLPMVFHYDTMNYHVECNENDELIFTCTRNDRSSPRIRYNLGDKGRIYASSDIQALLTKYGVFCKPKTNLPLIFIWGRDSTVVFNGANLAFTELERAITDHSELEKMVLKKAFFIQEGSGGTEQLEIWLELDDNLDLPSKEQMKEYATALLNKLAAINQDFRYQLEKLDLGNPLPAVRFFKRGQSPISEAGGHRKQVLVFQRGANLTKNYEFPSQDNCRGISLSMSADILADNTSLSFN